MVIVAAADHPITRRQASLKALQDNEWALREAGSGTRQVTERWLLEHLSDLRIAYELGSAQALLQVVQASRTLGCLSRLAAEGAIRQGLVREVRCPLPPASRRLAIAVHHERKLSARAQAFMQACLKLRRMPAAPGRPPLHRNLRQDV
jgi:DNA-binding transcriptional LysR family regulator